MQDYPTIYRNRRHTVQITIIVDIDEGDPSADPSDDTGLTEDAYNRLTGFTEHGAGSLSWLGSVESVQKTEA